MVGLTAAGTQLVLLRLLLEFGTEPLIANAAAFFVAANLNFGLSSVFTWSDRVLREPLLLRWGRYFASIAGTALLNMATFALTVAFVGPLAAAAIGLGVASLANFITADRFVFGHPRTTASHTA